MHSLIIFASGRGSNAEAILEYFRGGALARVVLIVSNKADAGVLDLARREEIPFLLIDKKMFSEASLVEQLEAYQPSLIVLAGFMWKIPPTLVTAFQDKIVNIHPALLPAYGGRGMYGHHVHEAVLAERDRESGITIHQVNERYDEGNIILQARCAVSVDDHVESLAQKIHKLEHFYYPRTIEWLLRN